MADPQDFLKTTSIDPTKPCRACTDFKTWMKVGGPTVPKQTPSNKTTEDKANTETSSPSEKKIAVESNSSGSSKEETNNTKQGIY